MVWWSELLTTNHQVPGSIPCSTMGIFPGRGRIPVVTMVWVVSRIRLKVETSVTKSHTSINSWLNPRQRSRWRGHHQERQPAHQLIEYLILWLLITEEKKKSLMLHFSCQEHKMTPFLLHSLKDFKCPTMLVILLSKFICCILSFGWFPDPWILFVDVSDHPVCSIFIRGVNRTLPMKMKQNVPKCRHINFRRRGNHPPKKRIKVINKSNTTKILFIIYL